MLLRQFVQHGNHLLVIQLNPLIDFNLLDSCRDQTQNRQQLLFPVTHSRVNIIVDALLELRHRKLKPDVD